ncbi:osomolarity two-component sensor histidine kinase sln1 [Stagonosporopsis vannaccii]|nr:osomolarity two-component sensor histidine kinase sln1 [Stagonosporopsis vannaccii]
MIRVRITISVQLGCLVFLATSIGLAIVALATWYTNHQFVKDVRSDALMLSASLKSAQVSSTLLLMQTLARQAALRRSPQAALASYYENDNSADQWNRTAEDYDAMFSGNENSSIAVQARIYHKEGPDRILFSQTASDMLNLSLPYRKPDGKPALMGDHSYGFIPELYPRFNVRVISHTLNNYEAEYQGRIITAASPLLSGPYRVGDYLTLVSITIPILNNTSKNMILGWLTVVLDARLINDVIYSREGLGQGGVSLLVGPYNVTNKFPSGYLFNTPGLTPPDTFEMQYKISTGDVGDARRESEQRTAQPFDWSEYSLIRAGFTSATGKRNNVYSALSTRNERQNSVSVGCAIVNSSMVDWMVLVERPHAEIWAPINRLRRVILTCVFGIMAGLLAIVFPIAHYLSRPIRRLRDATCTSVLPQPEVHDPLNDQGSANYNPSEKGLSHKSIMSLCSRWFQNLYPWKRNLKRGIPVRRHFVIPSKVKDGKHLVHDELTELTGTFNKMVDELMTRYDELEERVRQRTAELELSKEAAEAANKSKTLFIANISHELKTPLNGIMGMLAVCMSEDNSPKMKQSLEVIYKSGDLLSNLLTDLLTFREMQIGQYSGLDEKEFRLRDIGSQVLAIFGQQAEDSGISLSIKFEDLYNGASMSGDNGVENDIVKRTEPEQLKDMLLYGDEHLILRVILNLVSNSLKFTPTGGSITVTVRCMGELSKSDVRNSSTSSHAQPKGVILEDAGQPVHTRTSSVSMSISSRALSSMNNSSNGATHCSSLSTTAENWLSLEVEVQDTGVGIPKHLHSKIFEPFVQADLSLKKRHSGAGLGLSICARLAGILKGTMRMRSQVGRGSSFVMSIPLRRVTSFTGTTDQSSFGLRVLAPQQALVTRSAPSSYLMGFDNTIQTLSFVTPPENSGRLHRALYAPISSSEALERAIAANVLVAEDNRTNQEVITRMLELEGIGNVTIAADGQEAVDKVRQSIERHVMYDLIFMDVQMPNLDGLEATRLIRRCGFKGPIVSLTAYSDQANMEECLAAGMDAFLTKPLRRAALKDVLKKHVLPDNPVTI